MKPLTERQQQRREAILEAARRLIGERGLEGVNMRDLAREGGVTPKTLYHQFGNKEQLLQVAVEERFRAVYQVITDEPIEHGIDRLFQIIDVISATTAANLEYAKALVPYMHSDRDSALSTIRRSAYRDAVLAIAQEGDILPWMDVELLIEVVYGEVTGISHLRWYEADTPDNPTFSLLKLELALILRSVTRGYTHARATTTIESLQALLLSGGRPKR